MIVREFGVRHARRTLAAPLRQTWLRALSTEPPTTTQSFLQQLEREQIPSKTTTVLDPTPNPSYESKAVASTLNTAVVTPPRQPAVPKETAGEYKAARKFRQKTNSLGSVVDQVYHPADVFRNPPGPNDVTLELLMSSQAHMGHNTSLWNPANSRYIFGVREGIHIISLEQTAAHLRRAARVVEEVAYAGGLILFVGTRKGQMEIVTHAAKLAKACHLFTKWTPGTITNSDILLRNQPLKMVDQHDREVHGFDEHLRDARGLVPDLVVCLNPLENAIMLRECAQEGIPTIGVIDTDADPTWVTYQIPANDDSLRCSAVLASVLGRAGGMGQRRRLDDAENGKVTWQTPQDVVKFLSKRYGKETRYSA